MRRLFVSAASAANHVRLGARWQSDGLPTGPAEPPAVTETVTHVPVTRPAAATGRLHYFAPRRRRKKKTFPVAGSAEELVARAAQSGFQGGSLTYTKTASSIVRIAKEKNECNSVTKGKVAIPEVDARLGLFEPPAKGDFTWIDVNGEGDIASFKTRAFEALNSIGVPEQMQSLVSTSEILPTYRPDEITTAEDYTCFILRLSNYTTVTKHGPQYTEEIAENAEGHPLAHAWSVSGLTNRLSVIVSYKEKQVITLHAHGLTFLRHMREEQEHRDMPMDVFVWRIMWRLLQDNDASTQANKKVFDEMEQAFITNAHAGATLAGKGISKGVYGVMRRSSVNRRVMQATVSMLKEVKAEPPPFAMNCAKSAAFKKLVEKANQSLSVSEELQNSAKDLLNLHFGTAAHQTNELVKVFNILSATFMPLSFIVGFYGMNFEYLPGTGYACRSLAFSLLVLLLLFVVFSLCVWCFFFLLALSYCLHRPLHTPPQPQHTHTHTQRDRRSSRRVVHADGHRVDSRELLGLL